MITEALRRAIKKYQQSEKGKKAFALASSRWQSSDEGKNNIRKNTQSYIARRKQLESTMTVSDWNETLLLFGRKCAYCGQEKKLSQDHFIPVARGGGYTKGNIVPACKSCNSSKGDTDPQVWLSPEKYQEITAYLGEL